MTASHLRKRVDFLDKALDAPDKMDAEPSPAETMGDGPSRASSRSSNKSGKRSASPPPNANSKRKRRRVVQSDSESDDDTLASFVSAKQQQEQSAAAHVPQDEADESLNSTAASTAKANRKRFAILDSDSE